ncbi:MAG TPA: carbohydrate-binding protein, partial [Vicinamibacterales bacterium]|nr:carbohydrate-binding protein [Vicinamibacterales bacterium]
RTGPIAVPDTGGWQTWRTIRKTGVSLAAGVQVWRLVMDTAGPSAAVGNFNYIRVAASSAITGSERLAWNQPAADTTELSGIRYALYIDGNRTVLSSATCGTQAEPDGYPCLSPLPSMSTGSHVLELAAFVVGSDGRVLESTRSAPLQVYVGSP